MLLHRYFSSHDAFETLKDKQLKTSCISSFNDPFEFLYVSVGKATPEEAREFIRNQRNNLAVTDISINKLLDDKEPLLVAEVVKNWPDIVKNSELSLERRKEIIDQELRAVCFSSPNRVGKLGEILLWSHYARKHEGIRIGFEFPEQIKDPFEIFEIAYQQDRVEVIFTPQSHFSPEQAMKSLEQSAKVKSMAWKYEGEFRLLTKINRCEPKKIERLNSIPIMEYFLNYNQEWVKSVDFGVLCPNKEIQSVVDLLNTDYPNVIRRKAEFHKTEYALEYKEIH